MGVEQLDHLKEDFADGEFGIQENHFSSPEVGNLPVDAKCQNCIMSPVA